MNTTIKELPLDEASLSAEELSMPALIRELSLQKRPNWLLRKLMNALESKRQAKGLGWSRVWNKKDLNVFRTHKMDVGNDADFVSLIRDTIEPLLSGASLEYRAFAAELMSDPNAMMFVFHHNRDELGMQYEGLTLSIGRKVIGDRSKRDRLDLIIEDRRVDGRVDGLADCVRLYVCPWSQFENGQERFKACLERQSDGIPEALQELYQESVRYYHKWKGEEERQWSHWSASCIDYFGPRTFIPVGTSFS